MGFLKAGHPFGKSRPECLETVRRESGIECTLIAGKRTSLKHSEKGKPMEYWVEDLTIMSQELM